MQIGSIRIEVHMKFLRHERQCSPRVKRYMLSVLGSVIPPFIRFRIMRWDEQCGEQNVFRKTQDTLNLFQGINQMLENFKGRHCLVRLCQVRLEILCKKIRDEFVPKVKVKTC